MNYKDHVTQLIEVSTKIKLSLIKIKNIQYRDAIFYLEMAINSLKDRKVSQSQFIPKLPPQIANTKTSTINPVLNELLHSQNSLNDTSDYVWVKPHYRRGKPVRGHWRKK